MLPPVLRAWHGTHPEVRIRLLEFRHSQELRAAMTENRADLAVGPGPQNREGSAREPGKEEFLVVLPAGDPALGDHLDRIRLADLAHRYWSQYAPGNGLAEILDAACAAAGFHPRVTVGTEQAPYWPLADWARRGSRQSAAARTRRPPPPPGPAGPPQSSTPTPVPPGPPQAPWPPTPTYGPVRTISASPLWPIG
ncbi:LysR family transcriptional regulator substrate-binding protein [Streptomyces sp. NBC_01244]|uniref:LysR family transcriptional regulator substrate-binding protein n=1 Tax=Streptomyces sp. NBC_01244 TaxID=2903797 RepID=UPI003FA36F54